LPIYVVAVAAAVIVFVVVEGTYFRSNHFLEFLVLARIPCLFKQISKMMNMGGNPKTLFSLKSEKGRLS